MQRKVKFYIILSVICLISVCHILFYFWQLVSILLSCVWFAHPLSWEQWIGAVRLTFTFIEHHNELSHCTLLSCITLFLSQPLDQYWSPLTLILNHHGSSSSHTICDTIFLMNSMRSLLTPLNYQVIVFGAIYAKSFLRKAPEKTTSSVEHVQNGNSNNLKENPWWRLTPLLTWCGATRSSVGGAASVLSLELHI